MGEKRVGHGPEVRTTTDSVGGTGKREEWDRRQGVSTGRYRRSPPWAVASGSESWVAGSAVGYGPSSSFHTTNPLVCPEPKQVAFVSLFLFLLSFSVD